MGCGANLDRPLQLTGQRSVRTCAGTGKQQQQQQKIYIAIDKPGRESGCEVSKPRGPSEERQWSGVPEWVNPEPDQMDI
jgi:hypothetical protein